MPKVLIVDDEPEVGKALARLLSRRGFEVRTAGSGRDGLDTLAGFSPDAVLADFRMPGMNGADFLAQVKLRAPLAARFIISGFADLDSVLTSVNEGEIRQFFRKPWDNDELVDALRSALETETGREQRLTEASALPRDTGERRS